MVKKWIIPIISVIPISFALSAFFDGGEWRAWAMFGAAAWWRIVGPMGDDT